MWTQESLSDLKFIIVCFDVVRISIVPMHVLHIFVVGMHVTLTIYATLTPRNSLEILIQCISECLLTNIMHFRSNVV